MSDLISKKALTEYISSECEKWNRAKHFGIEVVFEIESGKFDADDSEVQRLREALERTLSTLTRMTAGEPIRDLDEVILHATQALSPQKGETHET